MRMSFLIPNFSFLIQCVSSSPSPTTAHATAVGNANPMAYQYKKSSKKPSQPSYALLSR